MWPFKSSKPDAPTSAGQVQSQQTDSCDGRADAVRQLAVAVGMSSADADELVRECVAAGRPEALEMALKMLSERHEQSSCDTRQSASGSSP